MIGENARDGQSLDREIIQRFFPPGYRVIAVDVMKHRLHHDRSPNLIGAQGGPET